MKGKNRVPTSYIIRSKSNSSSNTANKLCVLFKIYYSIIDTKLHIKTHSIHAAARVQREKKNYNICFGGENWFKYILFMLNTSCYEFRTENRRNCNLSFVCMFVLNSRFFECRILELRD